MFDARCWSHRAPPSPEQLDWRALFTNHAFVVTEHAVFATSGDLVATGRHQSGGLLHHKVVDPDDFGHPMEFWAYQ